MDTGKGVDTTVLKPVCAQRTCRRQAIGHCSVTFASMFFLVCWAKLFGCGTGLRTWIVHSVWRARAPCVRTGQVSRISGMCVSHSRACETEVLLAGNVWAWMFMVVTWRVRGASLFFTDKSNGVGFR